MTTCWSRCSTNAATSSPRARTPAATEPWRASRPGASTEIGVFDGKDHETDKFLAVASTRRHCRRCPHRRRRAHRSIRSPIRRTSYAVGCSSVSPCSSCSSRLTTWKLVGRTLAPVEAMRAEVDEISAAALDRRVPQPAGRDEIARLASTMNEMLDRLEHAQKRQTRVRVRRVARAALARRVDPRAGRSRARASRTARRRPSSRESVLAEDLRVQRLVEDLLLLARADEQTLPLGRRPVDLDDLVFEEARRLRTDNGLRIDTTGVSAARVMGDESALRRVVVNLAENAARHARTKVSFALKEESGAAVLDIADDGPGIPEADRRGSSSASSASTTRAAATTEAAGSGWRSSPNSSPRTAERCRSPMTGRVEPGSRSASRRPAGT